MSSCIEIPYVFIDRNMPLFTRRPLESTEMELLNLFHFVRGRCFNQIAFFCRSFLRYSVGVIPVNFLKAALKTDLE